VILAIVVLTDLPLTHLDSRMSHVGLDLRFGIRDTYMDR